MKHTYYRILIFASLTTSVLLSPGKVLAGFGVTPSDIANEYLRPGGHFEQEIALSRSDPNEDLEIVIEPALEEVASWFKFEPGMTLPFPKGQKRVSFKAIIDVPEDAEYGKYQGVIRVKAMSKPSTAGGVSVVKGARIQVDLVTTEIEVVDLAVFQLKMGDVTGGEPLKLYMKLKNGGNSPAKGSVKLTNMNLKEEVLEELEAEYPEIGPGEVREVTLDFMTQLGLGEYLSQVEVIHDDKVIRKERLVFRITERPAIEQVGLKRGEPITAKVIEAVKTQPIAAAAAAAVVAGVVGTVAAAGVAAGAAASAAGAAGVGGAAAHHGVAVVAGKKKFLASLLRREPKVLLLMLAAGLVTWVGMTVSLKKPNEVPVGTVATPSPTPTSDGTVQGAETQAPDIIWVVGSPSPTPLAKLEVITADDGVGYKLYEEADTKSGIIYTAKEGEKFQMIEERSMWYRVALPDGTAGWLRKSDVNQTTPIQE